MIGNDLGCFFVLVIRWIEKEMRVGTLTPEHNLWPSQFYRWVVLLNLFEHSGKRWVQYVAIRHLSVTYVLR